MNVSCIAFHSTQELMYQGFGSRTQSTLELVLFQTIENRGNRNMLTKSHDNNTIYVETVKIKTYNIKIWCTYVQVVSMPPESCHHRLSRSISHARRAPTLRSLTQLGNAVDFSPNMILLRRWEYLIERCWSPQTFVLIIERREKEYIFFLFLICIDT